MKRFSIAPRVLVYTVAAALLLPTAIAALAAPEQQQRDESRTFPASLESIELENLVGRVTVEGKDGGDIEVVATINAADGAQATAAELMGLLDIEWDADGDDVNIEVRYPTGRFDTYRYPQREGRFNTQTTYLRERVRVTSRENDDAVTLFVDFLIRVPAGVDVDIENHVGDVSALGLAADFRADTGSGEVSARNIGGQVEADTGSGNVEIETVRGAIVADTGSGDIDIADVTGEVTADTGSGDITLLDIESTGIYADTGSGTITLERVSGDINVDTGSGDIIGRDLTAGATIAADTGSGDVRFQGDLSGARHIAIDTSSGDVELTMSRYPGMTFTIETGSGSINVDLPDLDTVRSRRNYFSGRVGDGAADVVIDTGSGSVRIRGS